MPYIDPDSRRALDGAVAKLVDALTTRNGIDAGKINYTITSLIVGLMNASPKTNYATINTMIGVLECAKLELYRRAAAPYEDRKIIENGDVYTMPSKEKK